MRIPKGGIGVFDSGIGGLTVLSECCKRCKDELFYYYGDHTHAPYGNKSKKRIRRYTFAVMRKFRRLKVKAVVLACNTVTAVCVEELRKKFSFPIIGAEPAVYPAAKAGGTVYVLATPATCKSERYKNLCRQAAKLYPQSKIKTFSCDGLAGDIENGLGEYMDCTQHFPPGNPNGVVLGCTHYIYIKEEVANFYGCETYDGNAGIAKRLFSILSKQENLGQKRKKIRVSRPRLTTTCKIVKNLNKCSCKKGAKTAKNKKNQRLFFLGKSRERMHFVYEQMFGLYNKG